MNNTYQSDIDFVISWVDPNDINWQKKKATFIPGDNSDTSIVRYRDWDNLKYWFRAVSKFAPWVRKIHFVTDEQRPEWLNFDHPKLCHVNHYDYIDKSALPLFNSCAIEIDMHKIPGLSEKFVYFNDDMFLTDYITPDYYFTNGIPNDMAGLTRKCVATQGSIFSNILLNDYDILNKYFDKKLVLKQFSRKWFRLSYGKTFIRTLININRNSFDGLVIPHLSVPYLKTDFEKVWSKEPELLNLSQHHKFRSADDINHFIFRYWRMCEGNFCPRKSKGKYIALKDFSSLNNTVKFITRRKYPEICINDLWDGNEFERAKYILNTAFEKVLPQKCEFEK